MTSTVAACLISPPKIGNFMTPGRCQLRKCRILYVPCFFAGVLFLNKMCAANKELHVKPLAIPCETHFQLLKHLRVYVLASVHTPN